MLLNSQKDLDEFEEIKDQNAFLCYQCGKQLDDVGKFKSKILEIEDYLAAQLQNQHVTQLQKKRPSVQEASPSPVCKQIRQNEMIDSLETSSTKHSPIVKVSHFASM